MTFKYFAVPLLLAAGACNQPDSNTASPAVSEEQNGMTAIATPDAVHEATGTVVSTEVDSIVLDHGPVSSLNWPSMTMAFEGGSVAGLETFVKGDDVGFTFVKTDSGYALVSIDKR